MQLASPLDDVAYVARRNSVSNSQVSPCCDCMTCSAALQVLDRLGTLHLVRHALTQQMPQPDLAFNLGPAHAPMSRHLKVHARSFFLRILSLDMCSAP